MANVLQPGDAQPEDLSLNAGAELDDELHNAGTPHEELFEEITPGEVPELRKDLEVIAALESQLQDLLYVREDMLRARGMSRAFALEAQQVMPGFGGGAPLGFYTAEPSATRYKVSLEEISKGIWALIAAAAAAVVAAIVAFIRRFVGKDDPKNAAKKKAEKARSNLRALDDTRRDIIGLQADMARNRVQATPKDGSKRTITMQSLIEDLWKDSARYGRAMEFLQLQDPIFRDIIERGAYTQAFRQVTPALNAISNLLRQKLGELAKIAELDKHSFLETDKAINTHMLQVIAKPIELPFRGERLELTAVADRLAAARTDTQETKKGKWLPLDILVSFVADAYHASEIVEFFEEQQEIVDVFQDLDTVLHKLEKTAGSLATDGTSGHNSEGVAAHLREVIFKVGQDVNGYRKLFAELTVYGHHLERLGRETLGFVEEIEAQLFAMARRGEVELPQGWQQRANSTRLSRMEALFSAIRPR